jgi:hypothetical protein
LGVVFAFRPPEDALVLAVVELLVLELLDPQPAANRSAEQAITTGSNGPLLIGAILSRRTLSSA